MPATSYAYQLYGSRQRQAARIGVLIGRIVYWKVWCIQATKQMSHINNRYLVAIICTSMGYIVQGTVPCMIIVTTNL